MAVQIALEYFLQHLDTNSCKLLKIFSDSQSILGILTLNWKESGYKDITTEIRQSIATLRQKGAEVNISWTPGHASIVGNEIADALAKEAATEAKNQPECSRSTTIDEIKEANKKSQLSKWQSRWDNKSMAEHTTCSYQTWTPRCLWIFPTGRASVKFFKYGQVIQNSMTTETNRANGTVMSAPAGNPRHLNTSSSTVETTYIVEKLCS